jgi:diguanylate cyclase (GGDEF)-like protein
MMVDIDKFSKINDVYGVEVGNKILKKVADILKNLDKCKVFRFNGDVFVICIKKKLKKEEILEYTKTITKQINENPFVVDKQEFFIDLTYGIAMDKYNSIENAEIALNNAKKLNKSYAIYQENDKDIEKSKQFFYYKNKIKWAIENDKVILLYQPIVNKNLEVIKYEALVRIDDNGELISPYFFLDIALKTKQYDKLSEIIFTKAINMATKIDKNLSINFSYRDITNESLLDKFEKMVLANNVAKKLVLEILETEEVRNYNKIIEFINRFKKLGCKIAIDDYGSGYSSFEYILKMNLDYIKIDSSLIKNIEEEKSKIVVENIVNLAKQLNIKTIAEYVENENILKICQNLGIDEYQGYYFSPPKELYV